jgi:hypothetical protein
MSQKSLQGMHIIMLQQRIQMAAMIMKIEMFKKKMFIFGNGGTSWCSQNRRHRHEDSKSQIGELSSTGALHLYKVFERRDTQTNPIRQTLSSQPQEALSLVSPSRTLEKVPNLPPSLGYSYVMKHTSFTRNFCCLLSHQMD